MASPELESLAALLAASEVTDQSPVSEWRTAIDGIGALIPVADGVEVTTVDAGGVPAELHHPAGDTSGRALLLLHGGGYVIGSPMSHRPLASRLAAAAGTTVLVPDYRLAPEHPAPAALDDALAAWGHLAALDVDPSAMSLCGDSAGGGLALALTARLAADGRRGPASLVLYSPWTDLTGTAPSLTANAATDPVLTPALLASWGSRYRGAVEANDPVVSPLFGDLTACPRTLVFATDTEVLLDDATRLAAALDASGTEVHLDIRPGLFHDWLMYAGLLPEADDAVAATARFLAG